MSVMAERCSGMAFTLLVLWDTGSESAAGLVGFAGLLPQRCWSSCPPVSWWTG